MTAPYSGCPDQKSFNTLIGRLRALLTRRGIRFATAESCTGGIIASLCTDVPGSSLWFAGGVVAYTDDIKHRLLGVPADALRVHGAVSEAVVQHMAFGALAACGAQAAVAVSGIAGPDGGTPEKPVGTVWMAYALLENTPNRSVVADGAESSIIVRATHCQLPGSRMEVRHAAAREALRGMVFLLDEMTEYDAKVARNTV